MQCTHHPCILHTASHTRMKHALATHSCIHAPALPLPADGQVGGHAAAGAGLPHHAFCRTALALCLPPSTCHDQVAGGGRCQYPGGNAAARAHLGTCCCERRVPAGVIVIDEMLMVSWILLPQRYNQAHTRAPVRVHLGGARLRCGACNHQGVLTCTWGQTRRGGPARPSCVQAVHA